MLLQILIGVVILCGDEVTAVGTVAVSSDVSSSVKFFPAHPAERFELNGKVKVVSTVVR